MRHIGILAFSVTTCVLVPAAIHEVVAGKEQIAKLAAPNSATAKIGKAEVAVKLDRFMLDPGEKLGVHIEASNLPGKSLEVGLLVIGSNGTEGDRVQSPGVGIAFRTVKLTGKDGVASTDLAIPLQGAQASRYGDGGFGHYTVLVGPVDALAKLERWRKGSSYVGDTGDEIPSLNRSGSKFMSMWWDLQMEAGEDQDEARARAYTRGSIARVEAHTRPKSDAISLSVPDTAPTGKPFTVTVHVENKSRRAMKGLEVHLSQNTGGESVYADAPEAKVTIAPDVATIALPARSAQDVTFTVTPKALGVVGLVATARCAYSDETPAPCKDIEALQLGAFDATEIIKAGTETTPVVGSR